MAVLAVGGDDVVLAGERGKDACGHRLLSDVQVHEAPDLPAAVQLGALLLEPADQQHPPEQVAPVLPAAGGAAPARLARGGLRPPRCRERRARRCGSGGRRPGAPRAHRALPSVEVSPVSRPSSRALSSRRITFPLWVSGRCSSKAISRGATAPSLRRPNAMSSRASSSLGSRPGLSSTKALTISPATGSGLPITPACATAGCSISALSTSNGPIRWPADLITSSARATNQ